MEEGKIILVGLGAHKAIVEKLIEDGRDLIIVEPTEKEIPLPTQAPPLFMLDSMEIQGPMYVKSKQKKFRKFGNNRKKKKRK